MKTPAAFIAFLLFLLTLGGLYVMWYAVRGQKDRQRRKDTARKAKEKEEEKQEGEDKKPKKKTKWGVEKDAYCYPSINDVMGFEFVKVINVPDELKGKKKEQPAPKKKRWEESPGIGGLVTVSHNEITNTVNPNDTFAFDGDDEVEEQYRPKPVTRQNAPVLDDEEGEDSADISAADLEFASKLPPIEDWPNNDVAYFDDEEKIESFIEAGSKDMDSETVEQQRKAEDEEANRLLELILRSDEISYDDIAADIIS